MKQITKESRKRLSRVPVVTAESTGSKTRVTYTRPTDANDEKRWGKELKIDLGSVAVSLNGQQINSIKSVLRQVGEI